MTLIQIAELIAERAGRQYDKPFNLQMQDAVVYHRARYLANKLQKKQSLSSYYLQSFSDDLIDVNKDECAEVAECGCENIKRTKNKIPRPLVVGPLPFSYVGNVAGNHSYGWTTFGNEYIMSHSPITGKKPRHTYLNDYIYIFNEKNAERIRGEGVFTDPRSLTHLKGCGEEASAPCYSDNLDFPIDDELIQLIVEQILRIELRIPIQEPSEIKADKIV
jgi:hypothetical protein